MEEPNRTNVYPKKKDKMKKIDRMRAEIAAKKEKLKPPQELPPQREDSEVNLEIIASIPGLIYIPEFITEQEELQLVSDIDAKEWELDLKRKVQQYGYKFNHVAQQIALWKYENGRKFPAVEPIPDFLTPLSDRLIQANHFSRAPEQVIINEYVSGQGINPHVDKTHCFEETVASISTLSPCVMTFRNKTTLEKKSILMPRRSLLILTGDARYEWTHGIASTDVDSFNGKLIRRERRISVTFRLMIGEYVQKLK